MAIELGELMVRLVGNADSYSSMLTRATQLSTVAVKNMDRVIGASASVSDRFEQFAFKLGLFGQAAQNVGRILSVAVTAPVVAFGAIAVKSFAEFDRSMAHSLAVMGQVSPEMRKTMEQAALGISKNTVTTASQAAEAYGFLASAGLSAEQSLAALPVVNDFAIAGNLKLTQSVEYLTSAQQALGLGSADATKNMENMTRVADVFTRANQLSAGTIEDFATAMTNKFAGALRNAGKSLEEGTALLMAFAQKGLRGALAGTAGTRLLSELGTEALRNAKEWRAFGIEVFDSNQKLRSFPAIIKSAEKAMVGYTDKEKRMMFMRLGLTARASADLQTLLGSGQFTQEKWDNLLGAKGASRTMAADMQKNLADRFEILKNNVVAAAIEIGQTFLPLMDKVILFVQRGVDAWRALSEEQRKSVVQWAAIAATAGPALILVGGLITLIASALASIPAITALAGTILLVDTAIGKLGVTNLGVLDSLTNLVNGYRIGGIQIVTWMQRASLEIQTAWEKMYASLSTDWENYLIDAKKGQNEIALAGVKAAAKVRQGYSDFWALMPGWLGGSSGETWLENTKLNMAAEKAATAELLGDKEKLQADHAAKLAAIDKRRVQETANNNDLILQLFMRDQEKKQEEAKKTWDIWNGMTPIADTFVPRGAAAAADEEQKQKRARFPEAFSKATEAQVFSSRRFNFDQGAAGRIYDQVVHDPAVVEAIKENTKVTKEQGQQAAVLGE